MLFDTLEDWFDFWSSKGQVEYGTYLGEQTCLQTQMSWQDFVSRTVARVNNNTYFFGLGSKRACVFIEFKKGIFKTAATIVSPECAGSSCS